MRIDAALLFSALCAAVPAMGQSTFASITGTVTDASGAAIPAAPVVAVHQETNYRYTAQSNSVGAYTLTQLREGVYKLTVQVPGFKEFVASGIQLVSMDVRRLDVQLEVGAVDTRVEVTAGATLIETETARISDAKSSRQLTTLPLNTRSLWNFIGLSPGVVQAGNDSSTRRFAGSRANQSDASIDGITLSNQYDGTQISPLVSQIESFEEVRIDMANNTAEFGGIGQVTIVSKGGTDDLHGSVFDYYVTPWFRARNPFAAQRGTGVRHNPGASVGGPIYLPKVYNGRNRSFFYYSLETTRGSQVLSNRNSTVPIPVWREGDFSRESAIRDPFNNNAPFPGNRIPAARINPVSSKIQQMFYPVPNQQDPNSFRSLNYRVQMQRAFDPNTYWTTRLDHDPQPAWAQQYDRDMHPAWARVFEPPSVTGGESQGVMRILMTLYRETGDRKYLEPIPRALDYLKRSAIPRGQEEAFRRIPPGPVLARFYELKTNRPLYITKGSRLNAAGLGGRTVDGYEISYTPESVITHYNVLTSGAELESIEADYKALAAADPKTIRRPDRLRALSPWSEGRPARPGRRGEGETPLRELVSSMDERGAWTRMGTIGRANRLVFAYAAKDMVLRLGRGRSDGSAGDDVQARAQVIPLKENDTVEIFLGPQPPPERIISSAEFARNLVRLAEYVRAAPPAAR